MKVRRIQNNGNGREVELMGKVPLSSIPMENTVKADSDSPVSSSAVAKYMSNYFSVYQDALDQKEQKTRYITIRLMPQSDGTYKAEKDVSVKAIATPPIMECDVVLSIDDKLFLPMVYCRQNFFIFSTTILTSIGYVNYNITLSVTLDAGDNIYFNITLNPSIEFITLPLSLDGLMLLGDSSVLDYIIDTALEIPLNKISNVTKVLCDQKFLITTTAENHTIDWPSNIKWSDGTVPTLEANKKYFFNFSFDDSGNAYCTIMKTYNN